MINFPDSPTTGQVYTSGSTSWVWDGTKWGLNTNVAVSNDSMPVGSILWYANTTSAPPGWIAADGSAVSRTTYATLFAIIGTTYGSGDGSTTFNVPSVAATTGKYYIRYTTALGTQTTTSLSTAPVGTMLDWPTTSSYPTGYLRADGTAVSRTTYADLFALVGTTYGTGDGSTTFNLPNLPAAGSGSPVKIIKASLGGIVEPSTVAHASTHGASGSDPVTITLNQVSEYQSNRNALINGSMAVAQRGTSFTSTTSPANNDDTYLLDRWTLLSDGNDVVDVTQSTDAPSGFMNSVGLDVETINKKFGIIQFVENKNIGLLKNSNVTLSFWAKTTGSSIGDVKAVVLSWAGTADTVTSDVVSAWNASGTVPSWAASWTAENTPTNLNVTSSWNRFSVTANVDSATVNNVAVFIWCDDAATTLGDFLYVSGVQLERGSVATPFEFLPYGDDLARCQRYFLRVTPTSSGDSNAMLSNTGMASSTTTAVIPFKLNVPMRSKPTTVGYASLLLYDGVNVPVVSGLALSNAGLDYVLLSATSTGLTQFRPYALLAYNTASGYLEVGAEL